MINEDVSFRFDISDRSTVVRHSFVRRVSIRSTVETVVVSYSSVVHTVECNTYR